MEAIHVSFDHGTLAEALVLYCNFHIFMIQIIVKYLQHLIYALFEIESFFLFDKMRSLVSESCVIEHVLDYVVKLLGLVIHFLFHINERFFYIFQFFAQNANHGNQFIIFGLFLENIE